MRMPSALLFLGLLACDAATDPAIPAALPTSDVRADAGYTVTSLGAIPGETWSEARSINDQNLVVGLSGTKAFWYRSGVLRVLPTFPWAVLTTANDVNNYDRIVGDVMDAFDNSNSVLWRSPTAAPILIAAGVWYNTYVYAINDADVVVGTGNSLLLGGELRAFRWSAALGTTDLNPSWAKTSAAFDIDVFGQVTGEACDEFRCYAVRWSATGVPTILGVVAPPGFAWAIYGARVVGGGGAHQGFQWTAGTGITPVPAFDVIYGLSAKDRAVGFQRAPWGLPTQALTMRFTAPGVTTTLPALGLAISEARAVNRCGRIVGYSTDFAWKKRAVIWQPPVCD